MYDKSIELLNKGIADEMTAVHQYMYFHFHCEDQGLEVISQLFFRTAVEEMRHTELLAERILFLKGDVEMAASGVVQKIHDVNAMLDLAAQMEQSSIRDYNHFAMECAANADSGSKKVFETLVDDEERHWSQYDQEMDKIKKFGLSYLALQTVGGAAPAAAEAGAAA